MTLKAFNLDIPSDPTNVFKLSIAALDSCYDVCYPSSYIQNAGFV